ncbi:MAG: DUF1552 domain-containing protein [Bryobacteraceae bacterium]
MIVTKKSLPRRTFLRGLSTSIALPLLDSMVPAMAAPGTNPAKPVIRMGFVYHATGMIMNRWTPAAEGTAFEFPATMKPLEPFRDRLIVMSGLAQVNGRALGDGPGDHARGGAVFLTGVHPKKTEGVGIHCGISADQIAAKELGKHTQLASLELGTETASLAGGCDSGYSCAYTNTISWRDATTPLPLEVDPRRVFERLFGEGDSNDPAARRARLAEQRSILDYVAGSIDRMETRLGPGDRNKLTQYLEAIRDIERRIQKAELQSAALQVPSMERPASIPDSFEEHAKLMIDLQVLALQTDLTRVISWVPAREGSNRSYRSIGISDGHHSITHHQNDPEKVDNVAKIDAHLVQNFAYLLDKLKSTPDGEGSLLDHAMIVYGSGTADGNRHTHHDLPVVVAGGGAGQLKGGRHIRFPQETPLNNLFLNLLERAGVRSEKFGDATGYLTGV